jgi:hypothetical protein
MVSESEQFGRPALIIQRHRGSVRFNFDLGRRNGPELGKGSASRNPLWLRGTPSLAWVEANADNSEWLGPYLEQIRLVVVEESGIRGPFSGDLLEEAACKELAKLVEPKAAAIEDAYRRIEDEDCSGGAPEDPVRAAIKRRTIEEFEGSLERRDLGDGRLIVALGCRAPQDLLEDGLTRNLGALHDQHWRFQFGRSPELRKGAENPSALWLRGVPSLAWVEPNSDNQNWLGPYLEEIRFVVVDESGVRGPYSGDPLEESTCRELAKLVEPKAAAMERALHAGGHWPGAGVIHFESFLEERALGYARYLFALGYRAFKDTWYPEIAGPRYSFELPRSSHWFGEPPDRPNPLWLRGVPSLAWVEPTAENYEWLGPYLQEIRLVVVDGSGVRAPRPSDPREEDACVEISKLIEPKVAELEEVRCAIDRVDRFHKYDGWPCGWWMEFQVRGKRSIEDLQRFLEIQALSDTRFLIALGCLASADALAELGPLMLDDRPTSSGSPGH